MPNQSGSIFAASMTGMSTDAVSTTIEMPSMKQPMTTMRKVSTRRIWPGERPCSPTSEASWRGMPVNPMAPVRNMEPDRMKKIMQLVRTAA